jgi:hypothetical protein
MTDNSSINQIIEKHAVYNTRTIILSILFNLFIEFDCQLISLKCRKRKGKCSIECKNTWTLVFHLTNA